MSKKHHISVSLTRREQIWGWIYLALELLVLPSGLYLLTSRFFPGTSATTVNFLFYLLNFLAICLIFRSYLRRNWAIARTGLLKVLLQVLLGLVAYWVSAILFAALTLHLMPDFFNVNDQSIAALSQDGYLLMVLGTVVLVPTAEECLFRGLLFRGIYSKSRWGAYLVSAVAFAFIHISGYLGSYDLTHLMLCLIQYLPAGLILACSYEASNTIFTPIIIHTLINAIGIYSMR